MIAGVDGCQAGWLVALAASTPAAGVLASVRLCLCAEFVSVVELTAGCACVAVDIPIGLPSGAQPRPCDLAARQRLGGAAAARVFFAPPRGTLTAQSPQQFQSLHRQLTGKAASLPVWGIVPKLREVDATMTPQLQQRIIEVHPELVWQRLANAALPSKHQPAGLAQRHALLAARLPELARLLEWRKRLGRAAAEDDLLDALVCLVAAHELQPLLHQPSDRIDQTARRLPVGPVTLDERGLRMEIWC